MVATAADLSGVAADRGCCDGNKMMVEYLLIRMDRWFDKKNTHAISNTQNKKHSHQSKQTHKLDLTWWYWAVFAIVDDRRQWVN